MRAVAVSEIPRGRTIRCWRCVAMRGADAPWLSIEEAKLGLCARHYATYEARRHAQVMAEVEELQRYAEETGDDRGRLRAERLLSEETRAGKGDFGFLHDPLNPEDFDYAPFKAWRDLRIAEQETHNVERVTDNEEEPDAAPDDPLSF